MRLRTLVYGCVFLTLAASALMLAQATGDPFTSAIPTANPIVVGYREFATIPAANGEAPRLMHFTDEPGTARLFVNTMRGAIYSVSYDGTSVTPYLDINDPAWAQPVQAAGSERGFQSFAFHPQFAERGARGYGRFYTWSDTSQTAGTPDFTTPGGNRTHDTVLLEWVARDASASRYDGGPPRELLRAAQPFQNHNGGQVGFNPVAAPGAPDFGLLYIGLADGGSGGDPMNLAQNLSSGFGKILRIDPLGMNSRNARYGIPAANPFANDGRDDTLGEIYAYGLRNPQRFSWDAKTGTMYVADIGQNTVEEISPVPPGGNLGWNVWEGSFAYENRQVNAGRKRSDPKVVYPVAEYDHRDPLFQRAAITGVYVYRGSAVPALANRIVFGDNPSGEIFTVDADNLPRGGHEAIRRVLFSDRGATRTLLELIRAKNAAQGRPAAPRADLRFGMSADNRLFVLNKRDGTIRLVVPQAR